MSDSPEVRVHVAQSLRDIIEIAGRQRSGPDWHFWYYRGHEHESYRLVSKAGRTTGFNDGKAMEAWLRHARAYFTPFSFDPGYSDFLSLAQHHGLATRLLDWTFNPLTAAFFAVRGFWRGGKGRPVIWCHYADDRMVDPPALRTRKELESLTCFRRLRPSPLTPRIHRQGGIFTVHNPPGADLECDVPQGNRLEKIVLEENAQKQLWQELSHLGVNDLALFPDLDGLSQHMNLVFGHMPYTPKKGGDVPS